MKLILSIDGGGCRGVIPATILQHLEASIGKPTIEIFDMIAGTSTGAMIAVCAAANIPASKIVQLYVKESSRIFKRGWHRNILDQFGLVESKYPADGVEAVLDEYLGTKTIGDCKPYLLIPTFDVVTGQPHFFQSIRDGTVFLKYAARCSSAAPTYFPAKDNFVDGGMFANDPSVCALTEATKMWRAEGFKILSIGTGSVPQTLNLGKGGLLNWASSIINTFMNGAMAITEYEAQHILETNYLRIQEPLRSDIDSKLDDITPANIQRLIAFASDLYTKNETKIKSFLQ